MKKPTLIISLDFELFWGMQDCTTLEVYKENVRGVFQAPGLTFAEFAGNRLAAGKFAEGTF